MLDNHLTHGATKKFRLELIGIAAHVYMDTFSHYGFSGMSSVLNTVTPTSVECVENPEEDLVSNLQQHLEETKGLFAEAGSGSLGHAGAASFPDWPYLHWSFDFLHPRPGGKKNQRDNSATFLEGCNKLYDFFCRFVDKYYPKDSVKRKPFAEIKDEVQRIIQFRGEVEDRCRQWRESSLASEAPAYIADRWEDEKIKMFEKLPASSDGIDTNAYRFHQAAAYHRYYVLKDLLPEYKIAVY